MARMTSSRPAILRCDTPAALLAELKRMGHEVENVLIKTVGYNDIDGDHSDLIIKGHEIFGPTSSSDLVGEFRRLVRIHEVAPESVVNPIALYGDSEGKVSGYVMEFFNGKDLEEYTAGPEEGKAILSSAIHAFLEFHSRRIIHGDIAARNVLVSSHGEVKFIDPYPELIIKAEDGNRRSLDIDMRKMETLVCLGGNDFKMKRGDIQGLVRVLYGDSHHKIGSGKITASDK